MLELRLELRLELELVLELLLMLVDPMLSNHFRSVTTLETFVFDSEVMLL
jgi:hypothetical protein